MQQSYCFTLPSKNGVCYAHQNFYIHSILKLLAFSRSLMNKKIPGPALVQLGYLYE